jgi:hypothetical protein
MVTLLLRTGRSFFSRRPRLAFLSEPIAIGYLTSRSGACSQWVDAIAICLYPEATEGVAAWNAWRPKNLDIRPDLSKANLSVANLRGANLSVANLSKANSAGRSSAGRTLVLPVLFDFAVPATRGITETVSLLARMARFIIADLTDPSSIPKELEAIVPHLAVPVQPLIEGSSRPYAMFTDYWKYDWVLPVYRYEGIEPLLATLVDKVITPAEGKVKALQERRRMIEAELTKSSKPK